MTLILASASPRRQRLLQSMGLAFTVRPVAVKERAGGPAPNRLAAHNACRKAAAARRRWPDDWVLAADTVVSLDGRCIGKPASMPDAFAQLGALSGRSHLVFTAVVLTQGARIQCETVASRVWFRHLLPAEIRRYCEQVNPLDKAGAYDIGQHGDWLIQSYEGSWSNIVGLPLETVGAWLHEVQA